MAQSKEDWCKQLEEDMKLVTFRLSEVEMATITPKDTKHTVKKCVSNAAFSQHKCMQSGHKKINNIQFKCFKMQPYLQRDKFTSEEVSSLFNLRASTVNGFKMCFPNAYQQLQAI